MKVDFEIDLTKLRAANVLASTEETRYYLCGVNLRVENKQAIVYGTNGHVGIKISLGELDVPDMNIIIPRSFISTLKPLKNTAVYSAEWNPETQLFGITIGESVFKHKVIDGQYPDVERIFPKLEPFFLKAGDKDTDFAIEIAPSVHEVSFAPHYIGLFDKVNTELGYKNMPLHFRFMRGESKCNSVIEVTLNTIPQPYTGVLMPVRIRA